MNAIALRTARSHAAHLADLLVREHGAMTDFLLSLAEFDEARGWAELGHASLFDFLHRQLGLSRGAAHYRGAAARLARRHEGVAEALRDGRLCLSSVAELSKVLTPENEAEVLPRFFRLSAREAKEVVAGLQPHPSPPRREVVRAVAVSSEEVQTSERAPAPVAWNHAGPAEGPLLAPAPPRPQLPVPTVAAQVPTRATDSTDPLTAGLSRLHITVSRRFLEKLEAAKAARAHARPSATTEAILEEALDLLLEREEKRRSAKTDRPRRAGKSAGPERADGAGRGAPRHIPASVRREVWARDEGRCQWPLDGGGICGSTHRLQLDHVDPAARGGPPTATNLRILCEPHNREAARRAYGDRWMTRFTAGGRRRAPA